MLVQKNKRYISSYEVTKIIQKLIKTRHVLQKEQYPKRKSTTTKNQKLKEKSTYQEKGITINVIQIKTSTKQTY